MAELSKEARAAIDEYLANGGKITRVELGAYAIPITGRSWRDMRDETRRINQRLARFERAAARKAGASP